MGRKCRGLLFGNVRGEVTMTPFTNVRIILTVVASTCHCGSLATLNCFALEVTVADEGTVRGEGGVLLWDH